MLAFLAGAGFSHWAAGLPLAKDLFDFQFKPFGPRETKRLAEIRQAKEKWDTEHPSHPAEVFIHHAMYESTISRRAVLWYIVRRLSEPYIWHERHAFRTRRHVLMIDEHRALARPGVQVARDFLTWLFEHDLHGIVTTNYDLIIEYALSTKHFNCGTRGETLVGRGPYPVSQWRNPVRLMGRTSLAKVHGSISWDVQNRYTDGRRGLTGDALIVAPNPEKTLPRELLSEWRLAGDILQLSDHLIVFGFGFNQYDTAFLSHLQTHGEALKQVMLVDISPRVGIASNIWRNAEIRTVLPPPKGTDALKSWFSGLPG